jgi:hypothetical protein
MRLLDFLAQAFIAAFGITEPSPSQRRMVSLVLGGFILAVLLAVVTITVFLLFQIHSER